MADKLDTQLDRTLEPYQLLEHPFYRRWEAGGLRRDELTSYAEQYRFFEAMLPTFLSALSAQLPDGFIRDSVLANLSDEVTAPSHLSLFDVFARSFGATDAPMSSAMSQLITAYDQLLLQGPVSSLAGLWAYESQGAAIADSKAEGLVKYYGACGDDVAFWMMHGSLEGDHAKWTLDALEALDPDVDEVSQAAQVIGRAWWSFLDERELMAT
jgi:pyrroloquinoline quinone (PQQ) biosynthesis protein C